MIFRRLLAATCLFPAVAASTETLNLRRSIDPTLVVDETTVEAIAEYDALYKTLKEDFVAEGCVESWGEFPTATSTASMNFKPPLESLPLKGGMICNCAMIYDLAVSQIFRREEAANAVVIAEGAGIDFAVTETGVTQLDSWVMARTSNSQTVCSGGFAGVFPCKNVDLIAHLPLGDFKTTNTLRAPQTANDVWGWTSSTGREFVIWGVLEGSYFFEVYLDSDPVLLGHLPSNGGGALHHDMKVIGDFVYIGSEQRNHGMQIFDMKGLLNVNPKNDCVSSKYCQELIVDRLYTGVGSSHNIVANEDTQYIYIVGSKSCEGGLHVVDVIDPLNPTTAGCFGGGDYVHDAQCVNYNGPDPNFKGKEICFCFNENKVVIVDVTNKATMEILSETTYGKVEYTHQGWLSSDQTHIVFGDEVDEEYDLVKTTRTLVLNVENLRNPAGVKEYLGPTAAIDHNQYVVKATAKGQDYDSSKYANTDLIYQANYEAGLRILQVIDYETANFREVGYFDTYPLSNRNRFNGAWSTFPYFKSGLVAISNVEEGLFLVKPNLGTSLIPPLTQSPPVDEPSKFCSDGELKYQDKARKNCKWVGMSQKRRAGAKRRDVRKKCRTKWKGNNISFYCRETCGMVGLGTCRRKFAKIKESAETSEAQLIPL
jgi:choice-of-anchor B domain-containing protein